MVKLKAWVDNNLKGDPFIWGIIFALSVISILVVYSSTGSLAYSKKGDNTEYYLFKHTILVLLSIVAMWYAHKLDYKYYSALSRFGLILSIPLLVYAYVAGASINEASRWLSIAGQSFQPSDLAKLALIANLASMLAKRQSNIDDIKESFIPMVVWSGLICGLIALSNISTAVILFATCMLLMFIGRVPLKYLSLLILSGVIFGFIAMKLGNRWDTAVSRINNFVSGDIPDQAEQSFKAIASGGLFGTGPGQATESEFLPQAYSDFIFSSLLEEYGMIGGLVVLFLYLALLYRGMQTVVKSDRAFGGLLSAGLSFSLVIQAMINMGVAVGLGPVTGQPLPLLSMGGTSLLFTGLSLGIILSVSRGDRTETNFGNKKVVEQE